MMFETIIKIMIYLSAAVMFGFAAASTYMCLLDKNKDNENCMIVACFCWVMFFCVVFGCSLIEMF